MRLNKAIKKLADEKISKKEKLEILNELELETYEFELPGGYFYHLENTAPHNCYKYFHNFYLEKLEKSPNQPTQSNTCKQRQSNY